MINVSRETEDLLQAYQADLLSWNERINLISKSTGCDFHRRHLSDSLQLLSQLDTPPTSWTDLGSGGGLPGLVVAIALRSEPCTVTLIESDTRKAVFLRTVVRKLELSHVIILNSRIEDTPPQSSEVVSARALAPLEKLLHLVARHLSADGTALLLKGKNWREEISAAQRQWRFHYEATQSKTDENAVVLKINEVSRA